MKEWKALAVVEQDPKKVSGAWVFQGTRVPVSALFENLRDGASVDQFLRWFPGVTQEQVEAVLDFEAEQSGFDLLITTDQNELLFASSNRQ